MGLTVSSHTSCIRQNVVRQFSLGKRSLTSERDTRASGGAYQLMSSSALPEQAFWQAGQVVTGSELELRDSMFLLYVCLGLKQNFQGQFMLTSRFVQVACSAKRPFSIILRSACWKRTCSTATNASWPLIYCRCIGATRFRASRTSRASAAILVVVLNLGYSASHRVSEAADICQWLKQDYLVLVMWNLHQYLLCRRECRKNLSV